MRSSGLPILTYHAFGKAAGVTSADPSWFAETLSALVESGHRAVDLDDWAARGCPDVGRGFAVTFDDGLRSILRVTDVLGRHRVPATVFLVTDWMGRDNSWPGQPAWVRREPLLDWSDLDALHATGFRFAAHGRNHARLDRCDDAALDAEFAVRATRSSNGWAIPADYSPIPTASRRLACAVRPRGTSRRRSGRGSTRHRLVRIVTIWRTSMRTTCDRGGPSSGSSPVAGKVGSAYVGPGAACAGLR